MTLNELDEYLKGFLHPEQYKLDPSRNGLQVQNSAPSTKQIRKVAFSVDMVLETIKKAADWGADVLFTHHGLFWSDCEILVGNHYNRIKAALDADLALYGMHIPLDANNPYGNNYGLAARLGLQDTCPFGTWREMTIGAKGTLPTPLDVNTLAKKALEEGETPLCVLPFGKQTIKTVGIISGGGSGDVWQAIAQGLDCYITGEIHHETYHYIKESGINAIALGHYQSETIGVKLVAQKLSQEKGIETTFISAPTNL